MLLEGDSITAGFVMEDLPLEYRGSVYSTGGGNESFADHTPFVVCLLVHF